MRGRLDENERDLVIKTNTGGGKTIAGLLILQACIHEGVAPALYLAPDPHLAKQVLGESAKLGLTTVDDPESGKFLSGEAICVTTMQVLINGKSRFGLVGAAGRQPLPVNIVERSGTPPPGTRILNGEKLEALKTAVLAYATALAHQDAYLNEGKIAEQLSQHKLLAGDIINTYSVVAKRET